MAIEVNSEKVKKETPVKKRKSRKQIDSGFKRLKELDCFPEIEAKIKAGVSPDEVARWLQEDMFQLGDIQRESAKRQLYRYKASLPPSELLKATEEPLFIRKAIEKMKRGIDEFDEMEKLYLLQIQRISRDTETEFKINKLFKGTNREIQLATDLLEKMVKLKMELGILDKQPTKMQIDGIVGHIPVEVPEGMDERSADKAMTRMGLMASKLFKAIENMSTDDLPKKELDCEGDLH
jgi:hypothetical protein